MLDKSGLASYTMDVYDDSFKNFGPMGVLYVFSDPLKFSTILSDPLNSHQKISDPLKECSERVPGRKNDLPLSAAN